MTEFSPRKKPQQERSRRTYETIVDTASDLLVEDGYHNMSTNKIADRAGVSVGSIYQYFPNKEAIVLAVIEQFAERQYELLADGVERIQGMGLEGSIRLIIANMIHAKREDPQLNRVLFEELPAVGQHDLMHEWIERASTLVRSTLENRDEKFRPEDLETAAFLLVNACHGIVHGTVARRPDLLEDEELVDETTEMILRYIEPRK